MYHLPNQQIVNGYSYQQFFGIPTETVSNTQENQQKAVSSNSSDDSLPEVKTKSAKKPRKKNVKPLEEGEIKKSKVDTSTFSIEERLVAAAWVHERYHTHTSMGQIKQQFELRFGRPAPAKNTLLVWERKLFATGSVHDAPRAGRPAKRKLQAAEVSASLAAAPALSVRARAAALAVPRSTLRALLRHLPAQPAAEPAKKKAPRKRAPAHVPPPPPQPAPPPHAPLPQLPQLPHHPHQHPHPHLHPSLPLQRPG